MKPQDANLFYEKAKQNAGKLPAAWRRNGKTKTWKTRPTEFSIPVKFGLYSHGYITHENIDKFTWN